MSIKLNKRNLIHYVTISAADSISVPAHRIVRSEGFRKNFDTVKRIVEKTKLLRNKQHIKNEKLIQRFQGYVINITPEIFEVEFADITNPSNPIEIHTFNMNIISKVKQRDLEYGEYVYWDFYRKNNGDVTHQFKFVKPKKPTKREIEEAMRFAEEFEKMIISRTGE